MDASALRQSFLSGHAPRNIRIAVAGGLAPLPAGDMLDLLLCLFGDSDEAVSLLAKKTFASWDEEELRVLLKQPDCPQSVLSYFSVNKAPDALYQSIIENPSASGEIIATLASTVPAHLLELILDNRTRILEYPQIIDNIGRNPSATSETLRLVQEISETFLGNKRKAYEIESAPKPEISEAPELQASAFEYEIELLASAPPLEDLTLEGLPVDESDREPAITHRLSSMPAREKIRYALFGSREIRAMLVRDTNREIARAVLRSPKLRENEVESFASMRNVAEDILREIGSSREWTKSYAIVQNLVKNPKTPPSISQRLMFRLRSQDLTLMTRDRSIPDAVRHNATRLLKQRAAK